MKKIVLFIIATALSLCYFNASAKIDIPEEELDNSIVIDRITNDDIQVLMPAVIYTFSDAKIRLRFRNPNHTKLLRNKNVIEFIINGESRELTFTDGEASFTHRFNESNKLSIYTEEFSYSTHVTAYPLWAILVPAGFVLLLILIRVFRNKA